MAAINKPWLSLASPCTHPLGPSVVEVSKFDWQYSGTETAYVLEGGGVGLMGWAGVMGSWAFTYGYLLGVEWDTQRNLDVSIVKHQARV